MRRLIGAIPRAFRSHRSPEGALYRAFCEPYVTKFGGRIPPDARVLLRQAGRIAVDLERVNDELEAALKRRRMTTARRLRRQLAGMRSDLLRFTQRLDEMAAQQPPDLARVFGAQA